MSKLINNADAPARGWIHQFYVALEQCFLMQVDECIFIETYGDVTTNELQIEVKHEDSALTDLDENLWKTLKNWLDPNFSPTKFRSLILMTTQRLGARTSLCSWNEKSEVEKLQVLNDIQSKVQRKPESSEKTKNLVNYVLDDTKRPKLLEILNKFHIDSGSVDTNIIFQKLKEIHLKHISIAQQNNVINQLLGFILEPRVPNQPWEVSYETFKKKMETISNELNSHTVIFPNIETNITEAELIANNNCDAHLFIKKLDDINHETARIPAINHFINYRRAILELHELQIAQNTFAAYEREILDCYESDFRKAAIKSKRIHDEDELIEHCQLFYEDVISREVQPFFNFNNTPRYFRNGLIQELADDELKSIVWRVK